MQSEILKKGREVIKQVRTLISFADTFVSFSEESKMVEVVVDGEAAGAVENAVAEINRMSAEIDELVKMRELLATQIIDELRAVTEAGK